MLREKTRQKLLFNLRLGRDCNIDTVEKAELRREYKNKSEQGKRRVKEISCKPLDENVMEYVNNCLYQMLKTKVSTSGDANKGYVKRRIETFAPILNGQDEQMKQELYNFVGTYLALNKVEMYYNPRYGWSPLFTSYPMYKDLLNKVGKYMDKLSNARLKQKRVKKYNSDGTLDRYELTENDIKEGRTKGKPKYNVYLTVSPLEIETEKGMLTIDSKAYNDYLVSKSTVINKQLANELSEKVRLKVKFNHWKAWYKHYFEKMDMVTIGLEFSVSKSTISRWISSVNKEVSHLQEVKAIKEGLEKSIGYNTNCIFSEGYGKSKCCAYIPSKATANERKGKTVVLDSKNSVLDGNIYHLPMSEIDNVNNNDVLEKPHFDFNRYNDYGVNLIECYNGNLPKMEYFKKTHTIEKGRTTKPFLTSQGMKQVLIPHNNSSTHMLDLPHTMNINDKNDFPLNMR